MKRTPKRSLALALALLSIPVVSAACSLQNQEGPDVTCADLECGRINQCADGIIAQCVDGVHVVFRVCGTDDVCAETWQVTGQYKCTQDTTDCEGCRPERLDGCAGFGTSTSDTTSSTSDASSSSSGDATTTSSSTGAGTGGGGAGSSSSSG